MKRVNPIFKPQEPRKKCSRCEACRPLTEFARKLNRGRETTHSHCLYCRRASDNVRNKLRRGVITCAYSEVIRGWREGANPVLALCPKIWYGAPSFNRRVRND